MIRLTNTTDQPITATTGHTVPPGGALTVTDATWDRMCHEPYIAGQVRRCRLVPDRVSETTQAAEAMSAELSEAEPTLTADDVATMRKADVVEMIEAMNAEPVDGGVADLRAQLVGLL